MEVNKLIVDSAWYKEVILFNLTCSATLAISKEEAEIYNKFLLICNHHGKVSAKLFEETYGLDEIIARNILNILADELQILEKELVNGETYYLSKKDNLNDKTYLKEEKIYFQAPVRFSLCLYPLIMSDRHLYWEKIEDSEPPKLILEKLKKVEGFIRSEGQIKNYIGIPDNYCGFNFSEGIKLNGVSHCQIIHRNGQFKLCQHNYYIFQISYKHPDFSELKREMELLIKDKEKLVEKINQEITLKLHLTNFFIEFTEGNQDLIINIEEQDIDNIGEVYRIVSNNEGEELSVPIENGWFFKIKLKFKISNSILNAWINLMKGLNSLIKEEYLNLINDDILVFSSRIKDLINSIRKNNEGLDFNPFIEEIQKNIQIIANYSEDEWFQIIHAKFLEKEVIL